MNARDRYLSRARPGTSPDHAAEWLTHAIIAGEFGPGERVPQEEVAARIGISLIPVREALGRLEGDGQLVYRQRRGYFVSELTAEEMKVVFDLRGLLEDYTVRRALPEITDADVARMAELVAVCSAALAENDVIGVATAHWQFFAEVLGGERQSRALRLIRQLWDVTNPYAAPFYATRESAEAAEKARAAILDAVRERDVAAVLKLMRRHRSRVLARLQTFAKVSSDEAAGTLDVAASILAARPE